MGSIEGLTATGAISTEFVALILLPLVGKCVRALSFSSNAADDLSRSVAEHVTAVTVATKGKIDLSMAVAVGS